MSTEANKQVVLSWFEALVTGGMERATELMHDDFRFYLCGTTPSSGWTDKPGFLSRRGVLNRLKVPGSTYSYTIGAVTAEDDRVIFEAENDIPLTNGSRYDNTYLMACKVRDGKVVEFKEFSDTLLVYRTLDAPEIRGEPKPRESPLTTVTKTIPVHFKGSSEEH